ncbi:hypothetical protein KNSL1_003763 [Colletotrichum chrysophilum]|nr:hypothetical protein KNSL1_003763 [Colletotrichum chrysophilum]
MRTNVGVDAVGLRVELIGLKYLVTRHCKHSSEVIAGYGVDYLSVLLAAYVVVDVQDAFVRLASKDSREAFIEPSDIDDAAGQAEAPTTGRRSVSINAR